MLDRRKYKIRLAINDWLRCEGIAKTDKQLSDEQLKSLPRARPTPLHKPEKELVQRGEILVGPNFRAAGRSAAVPAAVRRASPPAAPEGSKDTGATYVKPFAPN